MRSDQPDISCFKGRRILCTFHLKYEDKYQISSSNYTAEIHPRMNEWFSFAIAGSMADKSERITAIERSIENLRKAYNSIKSDLALVERRRKKVRKMARLRSYPQVGWMLQAKPGRIWKQQQEQNSTNLGTGVRFLADIIGWTSMNWRNK